MKRRERRPRAWLVAVGLLFLLLVLVTQVLAGYACYRAGGQWVLAQGAPGRSGYVCLEVGK